jgi:hypothetical protein
MAVPAASEGAGGGDEALLGARHRDLDRIQRERESSTSLKREPPRSCRCEPSARSPRLSS